MSLRNIVNRASRSVSQLLGRNQRYPAVITQRSRSDDRYVVIIRVFYILRFTHVL